MAQLAVSWDEGLQDAAGQRAPQELVGLNDFGPCFGGCEEIAPAGLFATVRVHHAECELFAWRGSGDDALGASLDRTQFFRTTELDPDRRGARPLTSGFGGAEGIRTPDLLIAKGPSPISQFRRTLGMQRQQGLGSARITGPGYAGGTRRRRRQSRRTLKVKRAPSPISRTARSVAACLRRSTTGPLLCAVVRDVATNGIVGSRCAPRAGVPRPRGFFTSCTGTMMRVSDARRCHP
jgi:hypothetical protein